ncbi:hypothetical protein L2748_10585 [Shewanella sairae]|uniref:fimbrial biogenesis chaperone n=2 Tax=Shewanella sairae TaxID=190310 RepID=UPI00200FDED9|nr:hypothetical protein [Shewanella sairae]MCL1130158.1 hypothetical protein [Shewanella sairae]
MKKLITCCITALFAFNASANLLVNPTRVELDKKNTSAVFSLVNKGTEAARYNVYFEDKKMLANGEYAELTKEQATQSVASFVRYSPRRVSLEPEQGTRVRLAARVPRNIIPGEYRSYIVFHQIPLAPVSNQASQQSHSDTVSLNISAYLKISIPVIMRVGQLTSDLSIERSQLDSDKHAVEVTLQRTGDRSSFGDIEVINTITNEIVGVSKNIAIYTELSERNFLIPLTKPLNSSELLVRYKENNSLYQPKIVEAKIAL